MSRKAGLGKNLNALLGGAAVAAPVPVAKTPSEAIEKQGQVAQLPIEFLQPGKYQPRNVAQLDQHALQELADSIKAQGIIQPIVVRSVGDKRYEIIAGERRWRAAQLAQLAVVPCLVKTVSDENAVAMALIENIQREDLNPMEEAQALQRLMDEFVLTHQEVADAVGKSRTTVTNLLRLNNLQNDVKDMVGNGQLEMGHARALLSLAASDQITLARLIHKKGMTVRDTEKAVRALLSGEQTKPVSPRLDPNIAAFQATVSEKLGAKVQIEHKSSGKGRLVIQYHSTDELEGIFAHLLS